MPNHVATILRLSGDKKQIAQFIKDITDQKNKEGYDFSRALPCPEELKGVMSPVRIVSEEEYKAAVVEAEKARKESPEDADFFESLPITAKMSQDYKEKYGSDNWYDWMRANVGTKWGMYDVYREEGSNEFGYNTAWSPATEYFKNVSQQYPKVVFSHEFADEGGGFVGLEKIKNGKVQVSFDYDWDSDDGIEIRQNVGYYHDEDEEDFDEAAEGVI